MCSAVPPRAPFKTETSKEAVSGPRVPAPPRGLVMARISGCSQCLSRVRMLDESGESSVKRIFYLHEWSDNPASGIVSDDC